MWVTGHWAVLPRSWLPSRLGENQMPIAKRQGEPTGSDALTPQVLTFFKGTCSYVIIWLQL